jgi:hemerythrin
LLTAEKIMPPLWTPGLSVGVAEIDEQHQELFARIDRLLEGMRVGDRSEIARLFEFLGEYVVSHFAMEERWMKSTRYPDFAVHKAAHDRFVKDYVELKLQFQTKGPIAAVSIKVNQWLGDWLKAHIAGTDLRLARHLLAKGQHRTTG